jgi:hypothetical protein
MPKKDTSKYYLGNENLPVKGSQFEYTPDQIKELSKCSKNILHFAENYFYILNIDDGKKKIKLYKAQKRVLRKMMDNRFFILLASRQIGKSTLMTIYILWMANFHSDQRILLVANKESTAIEIFSRVRMAYEMLPNWLKSPVVEFAKTSMELENNSRISITTTTGTAARGQAVSCLIIDEAAFIESHLMEPFWASVFPIVSSSKKAKVFICSTPNGTGNLFYNIYAGSLENKNGWQNDKILWDEVPGRDEKWVKEIKGGLASEEKWQQEFECKFLNSGTGSMSEESYNSMKKYIIPPVEVLMDGKYKLFDKPQSDRIYVAGVDTAEGIGGDFSCIKVLDITDLKNIIEVAEYYDNTIPVSEFANKVREILSHWGDPLVCIERNNQGGQIADRLGYDMGYINKIISWGAKLAGRKNTQLLGMVSSRNTKYNAVANARYYYNDKMVVEFRNEDSLNEVVKDFVKLPNDSWGAISGKHDDRTMALIWALMVLHDDIIDQYFSVDELDDCGKPCKISSLDYGLTYFENPTSIYTNEQIDGIENSQISPIYFGASNQQMDDIVALELDGWTRADGSSISGFGRELTDYETAFMDNYF